MEWYNTTAIGDVIETEVEQGGTRYRWRPCPFQTMTRREKMFMDSCVREEPWRYSLIPEHLKPGWMK